jgi:hypothetical protein
MPLDFALMGLIQYIISYLASLRCVSNYTVIFALYLRSSIPVHFVEYYKAFSEFQLPPPPTNGLGSSFFPGMINIAPACGGMGGCIC